jgi:anaerobic glycerol-3-phosphate dehydrogenase
MTKKLNWKQRLSRASAYALVGAATVAPAFASGGGSGPIDLSTTGTTIAGYIAGAAGAGVAILAGLYGIRVIIRAFKAVK